METNCSWELTILDSAVKSCVEQTAFLVDDFMNDGHLLSFLGGNEGLRWYTVDGLQKGIISERGCFLDAIASADIDNDGIKELYTIEKDMITSQYKIVRFRPKKNINEQWIRETIDDNCGDQPTDIGFFDIDSDQKQELITVVSEHCSSTIYAYKFSQDYGYQKHRIVHGFQSTGLAFADLDADGKIEIISGPYFYHVDGNRYFDKPWLTNVYAKDLSSTCQIVAVQLDHCNRNHIIALETGSSYGKLVAFENCSCGNIVKFVEHTIIDGLKCAHSLQKMSAAGRTDILISEMDADCVTKEINYKARMILLHSTDKLGTWIQETVSIGQGARHACMIDFGNQIISHTWLNPSIHLFRIGLNSTQLPFFAHQYIDRDKPVVATDILACDVNGNGLQDIVCGNWWYKAPDYTRREIPYIYQTIAAYDVDRDGKTELICTLRKPFVSSDAYHSLSNELVLLKLEDEDTNYWRYYKIGTGTGTWPHGIAIGEIAPFNGAVLALSYHDSDDGEKYSPEIFIFQELNKPWKKAKLGDFTWNEEIYICDIDDDGMNDFVIGPYWLKNNGDETFTTHRYTQNFEACRLAAADITGNGRMDIIGVNETCDYRNHTTPLGEICWFENPINPENNWEKHSIDVLRSPHSLCVCDFDGDGELEIAAAEHDPFAPYHNYCRLFIYKKADCLGTTWKRYLLDDRFEHHDGCKAIKLTNGESGIISHGWTDSKYVHLWKPQSNKSVACTFDKEMKV
ncbi:MAG: hypothetical protein RR413_06505 [Christensenellaceae bacterium]